MNSIIKIYIQMEQFNKNSNKKNKEINYNNNKDYHRNNKINN